MKPVVYRFGAFELHEALYELRREGVRVKLEPKAFDLLAHLVRQRDRVVSKRELLDSVWSGEAVSEAVLHTNVAAARRALGEEGARSGSIQTVHGRGYRFVAQVRVEARELARVAPPAADLVGREEVLGELRAALDDARAGRGRLVLLVGDPGIGKTRTAEALAREAHAEGVRVLVGRCHEGEGAPAFWPWVQILRSTLLDRPPEALREALGPGTADVAALVPELRERLPDLEPVPGTTPEQERFRFFDAVLRLLTRESREAPTLVLLDDLHWADRPSLLLLLFLIRQLGDAPLLVVGAYREIEARQSPPLARALGDLAQGPRAERIALGGLDREAVGELMRRTGRELEPALLETLYELTEGNPFFVGEVVELWRSEVPACSGAARDEPGRLPVPQSVRDAIGHRLEALSRECRTLLDVASVLGRRFGLRLLERASGLATERVLALLDEAHVRRFVEPVPDALADWHFAHLLLREVLYAELPLSERVRLHRRAAEALEALHGADGEHVAALAHHRFQAAPGGEVEEAIAVAERAADRAARVLAYEEAAEHLERALQALELLGGAEPERRCALLLSLAEARERAAEFERSRDAAREALALARRLGRADLLSRAALVESGRFDLGPLLALDAAHLEEALEALGETRPELRCRLLARLAVTHPYRSSAERRRRVTGRAVALAREHGDPETLLEALVSRGDAGLLAPEADPERLEVADEVEALARRHGRRDRLLHVHEQRLRSFVALGDIQAADRAAEAHRRLAAELRDAAQLYSADFHRVARAIGDGRFDAAEAAIREMRDAARRLAPSDERYADTAAGIFYVQVFHLLRHKGEVARLPPDPPDFVRRLAPVQGPIVSCVEAYAAWFGGRPERTRRLYRAVAEQGFDRIPRDEWYLAELAMLAELAAFLADANGAATLYERMRPYASRNVVHPPLRIYDGAATRFLGLLAASAGEPDRALEHLEEAAEANLRMGARPALAWSLLEQARLRLRRAGRGDRERANALLDRCEELAEALPMPALRERVAGVRGRRGALGEREARPPR